MSKQPVPITASTILKDPIHFLAWGFGSGLTPKGPGTAGSVVGLLLFIPLSQLSIPVFLAVTTLLFLVGIWLCGESSRKLGVHDHGGIVWDEIVGMQVTLFLIPMTLPWLVAGFALFRFFDIIKPWPIKWLDEKVSGGFGIMIDDLLAGLFAFTIIQLILVVI